MEIFNLLEMDFQKIIALGNEIYGENYLNIQEMEKIFFKGLSKSYNCNYVAYENNRDDQLIGFRLTYAPEKWEIDEWCTTKQWKVPSNKVCYLKSNAIKKEFRRKGIGKALLNKSITSVRQMGGKAGLAHIWVESPDNSAMHYFSKAGGQLIKLHKNRWSEDRVTSNYLCILDGDHCTCSAAEMILYFGEDK